MSDAAKNFQAYISRELDERFERVITQQRINRKECAAALLEWFVSDRCPQDVRAVILGQVSPVGAVAVLERLLQVARDDATDLPDGTIVRIEGPPLRDAPPTTAAPRRAPGKAR